MGSAADISPGVHPLGIYLCIGRLSIGVCRYVRLIHEHNQKAALCRYTWGKDERLDHDWLEEGRGEECEGG